MSTNEIYANAIETIIETVHGFGDRPQYLVQWKENLNKKNSYEKLSNKVLRRFNKIIKQQKLNRRLRNACNDGNLTKATNVVNKGAYINQTCAEMGWLQNNPLHCAVIRRNIELVGFLIGHKANVNFQTNCGNTPLHCAVERFCNEGAIIKLLVDAGADPEIANNSGNKPIYFARIFCNDESEMIVNHLLNVQSI